MKPRFSPSLPSWTPRRSIRGLSIVQSGRKTGLASVLRRGSDLDFGSGREGAEGQAILRRDLGHGWRGGRGAWNEIGTNVEI